jgi:hypothetical protein
MSEKSDAELLKIINEQRNDYQIEAVEAAEIELKNRNLDNTQIEEAIKHNEITKQEITEKANLKLGTGWKILTFIFPGIIQVIFAGTFKADGYDRKAKELTKWTLYGFGFYIGFAFLIIVLARLL